MVDQGRHWGSDRFDGGGWVLGWAPSVSSAKGIQMTVHAHRTSFSSGAITAVVCLALAAVVAAMASLNVALPDIARDTHASQTDLTWIIDAYSLAFASLLLPG
ncbi:MAG TPA: hypothetical protein VIH49_01855, partial [Solirubrobacteraceae bacterium]